MIKALKEAVEEGLEIEGSYITFDDPYYLEDEVHCKNTLENGVGRKIALEELLGTPQNICNDCLRRAAFSASSTSDTDYTQYGMIIELLYVFTYQRHEQDSEAKSPLEKIGLMTHPLKSLKWIKPLKGFTAWAGRLEKEINQEATRFAEENLEELKKQLIEKEYRQWVPKGGPYRQLGGPYQQAEEEVREKIFAHLQADKRRILAYPQHPIAGFNGESIDGWITDYCYKKGTIYVLPMVYFPRFNENDGVVVQEEPSAETIEIMATLLRDGGKYKTPAKAFQAAEKLS